MSGEGPAYRAQDPIDDRGRSLISLWRAPGPIEVPQVAALTFPAGICAPLSPGYAPRGLHHAGLITDDDLSGLHGPSPLTRRSTMELDTRSASPTVTADEAIRELPMALATYEDGLSRLANIVDRVEARIAGTLTPPPPSDDGAVLASTGAVTHLGSRVGDCNMTLERIIMRLADLEHRCQL